MFKEDFSSRQATDKNHLGPTRSLYAASSAATQAELQDPASRLRASIHTAASLEALAVMPWRQATPRQRLERLVHSTAFEAVFIVIILVNLVPIALELSDDTNGACRDPVLPLVNYGFLTVYAVEYILRLVADGKDYVPGSLWGFIDTFIMLIGVVTVVTNVMTADRPEKGTARCEAVMAAGQAAGSDQSQALHFIKVLRIVRVVRLLRLFRFLLPADSKIMTNLRNAVHHEVFEECTALTTAQNDIKLHLEKIPITLFQPLAESCEARTNVNVYLGR